METQARETSPLQYPEVYPVEELSTGILMEVEIALDFWATE